MPPQQDSANVKPANWAQALADICIRQYGSDPAVLVPLLEKLEEK